MPSLQQSADRSEGEEREARRTDSDELEDHKCGGWGDSSRSQEQDPISPWVLR